ncbi:hypothetical protein JHK87_004384 [Glycine soja]|nr:hypothetical protein JHK87_004384 [Glycine soja]
MLDPYHSFLTPKMVEALSFTQDLLKGEPSPVFTNEDFEEIEKFEEDSGMGIFSYQPRRIEFQDFGTNLMIVFYAFYFVPSKVKHKGSSRGKSSVTLILQDSAFESLRGGASSPLFASMLPCMVLPLGDLAETDTDKFFSLEKRVPSEYCLRFRPTNLVAKSLNSVAKTLNHRNSDRIIRPLRRQRSSEASSLRRDALL